RHAATRSGRRRTSARRRRPRTGPARRGSPGSSHVADPRVLRSALVPVPRALDDVTLAVEAPLCHIGRSRPSPRERKVSHVKPRVLLMVGVVSLVALLVSLGIPTAAAIKAKYGGQSITVVGDAVGGGHQRDTALASRFSKDTGIKVKVVPHPAASDASYSQLAREIGRAHV